jgi:hypothetical protein
MTDDRTADAVAAFQAAALQLIAASRALLDVAEELVNDPAPLAEVVSSTIKGMGDAVRSVVPTGPRDAGGGAADDHVQHIKIS